MRVRRAGFRRARTTLPNDTSRIGQGPAVVSQFDGPMPDLGATAEIVSSGLLA
ncbi:MAG TPA: hypothetical protein VIM49_09355 [Dermatophilaceae bacterium]